MLMLTLTLILLHQPETTATFASICRLCHSNYDLSTPTLIRSLKIINLLGLVDDFVQHVNGSDSDSDSILF